MYNLLHKIERRLWAKLVRACRFMPFYPMMYRSYWHCRFHRRTSTANLDSFFCSVPNPGAGIGHQLANWIAGYGFARQFSLKFAHARFASQKWEEFLGLGEDEPVVDDLLREGYKKVRLPLFDEYDEDEFCLTKQIIRSYSNHRVVFITEQDQFYHDQFRIMDELKRKFFTGKSRENDKLIYSKDSFNIAIHIRRGDIVVKKRNKNPNLEMRWQENSYFEQVLSMALNNLPQHMPVAIYLFSQGQPADFQELGEFENIHFCLDMSPLDSFLHMIHADLLITSKSSFSYKPALFCKGIKISPEDFWHGYPDVDDWILASEDGRFNIDDLTKLFSETNLNSNNCDLSPYWKQGLYDQDAT